MNEKVTSILFLAIVALVLVGFLSAIIILIVKKVGRGMQYKSVTTKYGWSFEDNSPEGIAAVEQGLETTLYSVQPGVHELSRLITGQSNGVDFKLVRLHYSTIGVSPGRRRSSIYTLLIIPRGGGPEFWFMHRLEGALAGVAEKFTGSALSVPSNPSWSWSLFSSQDAITEMGFGESEADVFKKLTSPGDGVFVFSDVIIYGWQSEFNAGLAKSVAEKIMVLRRLLVR